MDERFRQNLDTAAPPLVSVIVPVYNMAAFVGETLTSVLASTYPALEVVVVDDGSTDDSFALAQAFAEKDERVRVYRQANAGVCRARNYAVRQSAGKYILPVDADNLLVADFLTTAVAVLEANPQVKVVAADALRFGEKNGLWHFPPFSLSLLARRNIMDTCALYRRTDFDRIGGYCEDIAAREDWDFWIAMLKAGGEVVRLSEVGFYYRVRKNSKRIQDRKKDKEVIRQLNQRHPEFFYQHLGGPLRPMRSWSKCINRFLRGIACLPSLSDYKKQIHETD